MSKIRVLVVDDSAYNRQTIKSMLMSDPDIEVIGIAGNGIEAISKTLSLRPDLITLDFEMPEMDGFNFLRWLMQECPTPVIMVSSHSNKNMAIKALEFGAVDFIAKPTRHASSELKNIETDLLQKARAALSTNMKLVARNISLLGDENKEVQPDNTAPSSYDIIAIASSTGGPAALQIILTQLPADLPVPIVVSQHMPKGFTGPLANRLNGLCSLRVLEAAEGDVLSRGSVYICPGGYHMSLLRQKDAVIVNLFSSDDGADRYVPSADVMINSALDSYGNKCFGIVLTGMGNDGLVAMKALNKAGGYTLVESEETAIVYGMPGEVAKAGAAKKILPVEDIAAHVRAVILGERRR